MTPLDSSRILAGGFRWLRCSKCGRPALAVDEGGRCRQRAAVAKRRKLADGTEAVRWECGGKLSALDHLARKADAQCQRQGCRNAATPTPNANGERVCRRCRVELGLLSAPTQRQRQRQRHRLAVYPE